MADGTDRTGQRRTMEVISFIVMSAAVTGYFIGIKSPMNPEQVASPDIRPVFRDGPGANSRITPQVVHGVPDQHDASLAARAILATAYAEMSARKTGPNRNWATSIAMLKQPTYDPFADIKLDPKQKLLSLSDRATLRAFNTAPPTVPHPIDQMSWQGCLACHGEGVRVGALRIAKMPHPFYANCTQCHVEQAARDFPQIAFRENSFVGMAAPTSGPRAHEGAPPMVPHSTWMRNDCLSCHGRTADPGLETTHPWRHNCLQCHVTSAQLDQVTVHPDSPFLPPPAVESPNG